MATSDAPLTIGTVSLTVNDLEKVAGFYREVIGLQEISREGRIVRLGAGDRVLIELREDRAASRPVKNQAGLFHTAFLLPDRSDLGAWLTRAADQNIRLDGASDHLVSEAVYLTDPEDNGIEIYTDRPRSLWLDQAGEIAMATNPLQTGALMAQARGPWRGAPAGTVVGHVHLQVGDLAQAEAFHAGLGFATMAQYTGAVFLGSGGYHHHIGANVWNSAGAGPRAERTTGLAEVELLSDAQGATGAQVLRDPWGTQFRVTRAA